MLRIALAQINPTVGDIKGNANKIISYIKQAIRKKVNIIVFPELVLTGYPPEDLLNIPQFIKCNLEAFNEIKLASKNITSIIGFACSEQVETIGTNQNNGLNVNSKTSLYNAAGIISNRKIISVYHKMNLPNYGVFDEKRYFADGRTYPVFKLHKTTLAVNVGEDIWVNNGPTERQVKNGKAEIIINISASPFYNGRYTERCDMLSQRARENKVYIVYVNLMGGQDELVFDGRSMVFNPNGKIIAQAKAFEEDLLVVDIPNKKEDATFEPSLDKKSPPPEADLPMAQGSNKKTASDSQVEEIYETLKLGLKDYITKNNFTSVIIGLSGGIDSALTALIAVDVLGNKNVLGLYLPSEFSATLSMKYVISLAKNLNIKLRTISIVNIYHSYLKSLKLSRSKISLTHENLQARIRGNILMAFSNKLNSLVLATGNKSELSTGYATLYGDMAGGFALLKDVSKTLVYELVSYGNGCFYNKINKTARGGYPIPLGIIQRPPTAELKPNQKDSDTLPEYETLDPILQKYVEENKELNDIIKQTGTSLDIVSKVMKMVDRSEYKRRQSPPGVKITPDNFSKGRRFPITNKFFPI
ncbi:MAG: NAD+ synthase [Planctomycetota bacterium]